MSLFNLRKKKAEVKEESCCCAGGESSGTESCDCVDVSAGIQNIKVLGAGCKSCHEMYENTKKAVEAIGIDVEVEYITDMEKVMAYGIMSMPGLVVNEKVVSAGKVLKSADIEKLRKHFNQFFQPDLYCVIICYSFFFPLLCPYGARNKSNLLGWMNQQSKAYRQRDW